VSGPAHIPIALVACMARNRVIGRAGNMPWRMPSDLKLFKATTLGKPVIMGRKTFESIGRPLPGRTIIVVSRQPDLIPPGTTVVADLEAGIAAASDAAAATGATEIMVAGGGEIYRQALPRADQIHLTILSADVTGDTMFPPLPEREWIERSRTPLETGPTDDYAADVVVYQRRRPAT
jgi:dihydrofolate reductase